MKTRQLRRHRKRRGASAVEFAVVSPVVFGIIWIAFEFMRMTMIQELADIASYEAAREVMVPGAKIAEAHQETDKYLRYLGTRDALVNVTPYDANDNPQAEIDDYTNKIAVTVAIPAASNVLLLSRFFGDRIITSNTTLTYESYSGFYDGYSN